MAKAREILSVRTTNSGFGQTRQSAGIRALGKTIGRIVVSEEPLPLGGDGKIRIVPRSRLSLTC